MMKEHPEIPYQLLVLDIDGTLLDDNNQISTRTLEALKVLRKCGIIITLATGRLYHDACHLYRQLELSSPMILLHGALIQSCEGKIISEKSLSSDTVAELAKIARRKHVSFQAFTTDCLILEKKTHWNDLYLTYSPGKPEIICVSDMGQAGGDKIIQFAFLGEEAELLQIRELVDKQLKNSISVACSHPNLLEIVAPGVNKGNALKELASLLNITLSQIIAIGDNYNDKEMIQTAGLGVAMGNAPQEVKDVADVITEDNNHDGIACFVDRLFKREQC